MAAVEQRVEYLEAVLGQFIVQTNTALARMERGLESLQKEMRAFKDEMKVFKDEMKEFKDEMSGFKKESEAQARRMNEKWGELANKMGTFVEDLVYPSMAGIIRQKFSLEAEMLGIRIKKRFPGGANYEADAIALAGEYVFLNSTRSSLDNRAVNDFIKEIPRFRQFFPEYADRKLIGILASLYIDESVVKYAERKGFLVLGVGIELMEIKNTPGFTPKEW
ncbi:MAG: hypothetical protein HUU32_09140 [Calditrichaceae bacterium]|nr:hypothetical protein [Calditrichia bacterium]NUQ41543.1 hypothetical protein [Calditrichaceae bacterium]